MMGDGAHASFHSAGTVDLKFTLEKIVELKKCATYSYYQ
jgi:hypothetical protein